MTLQQAKMILVCDCCLRACCYYGEFMCDDARGAGTGVLPVQILKALKREHPEYWTNKTFDRIYGTTKPDFSREPPLYQKAKAALAQVKP